MFRIRLVCVLFLCGASGLMGQGQWPQFRGKSGNGLIQGKPPTTWNIETGENILWKRPVEGLGHSGPIVWGDKVFLTTAIPSSGEKPEVKTGFLGGTGDPAPDKGLWEFEVRCFDRKTGRGLWRKTVRKSEPKIKRHLKATHANCTAATDGNFLVAFFGSEGLYCFDMSGRQIWMKDYGKLHSGPYDAKELEWGFASSPVIHDGKVVVQCDCLNQGFVSIVDLKSGKEVRRIERDDVATWSTPCIVKAGGRTQIVCNGFKQISSYDFDTGEVIWTLSEGGDVPVPTPFVANGLIFITNSHLRSPTYAIAVDAKGNLKPEKGKELPKGLVWHQPRSGSYMPTPIVVGDLLYNGNDRGVLSVREAKTGKEIYKKRITSSSQNFSASAIASNDHVYFFGEKGDVFVVKTGKEFDLVATNKMNEIVMATPAASGNLLFIRTVSTLYCIGNN